MTARLDDAVARLDDYMRGRDADDEAAVAVYEDDLFARAVAGEAPELAFRAGLAKTLQVMNAAGTLELWLTPAQAEKVLASGARVRFFELDVANPGQPDLSGEFDILVTKVEIDLTGVRRLDVEVCAPTGEVLKVMPEVAFEPDAGVVYACCEAELARAAGNAHTVTRVWATDDFGRRLLATIAN